MISTTGQIAFDEYKKRNSTASQLKKKPLQSTNSYQKTLDQNQSLTKTDSQKKLDTLAETVSKPLLTLTTISWLKVFPITITLDLRKVTIDETTFFKSHSIKSIGYEALRDVSLETGILSSTLRFTLISQTQHPLIISQLPTKEAIRAKQIIIGLIQCHKENIKSEDLDPATDLEKIVSLGKAVTAESN